MALQKNRIFRSKLFIFLIILVVVYFGINFTRAVWDVYQIKRQMRISQSKVEMLTMKNEVLRNEIQQLQSKEHIEYIAREKLGMVREGEKPFIPIIED